MDERCPGRGGSRGLPRGGDGHSPRQLVFLPAQERTPPRGNSSAASGRGNEATQQPRGKRIDSPVSADDSFVASAAVSMAAAADSFAAAAAGQNRSRRGGSRV
jgi:hypothetical protein